MSAARIMIVDDNRLNIELAAFVLAEAGFTIEIAEHANDALTKIPAFQPQLILMDIQMPGMNGLELTALLKAAPATRDITIVAFTGYAMKGDEEKMRAAGCDGYLSKPIDVATFAASVSKYLSTAPN
jgi:two-component system cell cycle response regulator DivK